MSDKDSNFGLIYFILDKLLKKESNYLDKRQRDLISRNVSLGGSPDGFKYLGELYSELVGAARTKTNAGPLHADLVQEMESLRKEKAALQLDRNRVGQALAMVLQYCISGQDVRDALPNGLKDFIPHIANLDRTREEAFTLKGNPRAYQQYMKLREKLQYYIASHLIH